MRKFTQSHSCPSAELAPECTSPDWASSRPTFEERIFQKESKIQEGREEVAGCKFYVSSSVLSFDRSDFPSGALPSAHLLSREARTEVAFNSCPSLAERQQAGHLSKLTLSVLVHKLELKLLSTSPSEVETQSQSSQRSTRVLCLCLLSTCCVRRLGICSFILKAIL